MTRISFARIIYRTPEGSVLPVATLTRETSADLFDLGLAIDGQTVVRAHQTRPVDAFPPRSTAARELEQAFARLLPLLREFVAACKNDAQQYVNSSPEQNRLYAQILAALAIP